MLEESLQKSLTEKKSRRVELTTLSTTPVVTTYDCDTDEDGRMSIGFTASYKVPTHAQFKKFFNVKDGDDTANKNKVRTDVKIAATASLQGVYKIRPEISTRIPWSSIYSSI